MALTDADIKAAFDEEAGQAASLATATEVRRWFNEGASRLDRYAAASATLNWAAAATEVDLPADFHSIVQLDYPVGASDQSFRVFGDKLVIDNQDGATDSGSVKLYYWAERALLAADATSQMSNAEDYACLYYALHRFYRKLVSNRVQYVRYATLLGQNAIGVADLQAESDRLYQDYIDARSDLPLQQTPSGFYGG